MSSGRHRRAGHKGWHRKPSRAKQYTAYAGTTAAAGVIAAGLAAGPAGASVAVPQTAQVAQSSVRIITAEHLTHLHFLHFRHLAHLMHLERMREYRTVSSTFTAVADVTSDGIYSPGQLGELWLAAGGSPAAEGTAECIAHFESGGNPNAISPSDDFGLWQINASHGALATLNPQENARSAVIISDDGTNWGPWTTAPDCGV